MLRTAQEGPQHCDTQPEVANLDSPEPPALAAQPQAGAPSTINRAEVPNASRASLFAQRALDLNSSASAPMAPQQLILAGHQAPWVLPPELAAPTTSPLRSSSISSSSAATTSPLPHTPGGEGAVAKSEGGPKLRTHARISLAKSPSKSSAAKSPA